LLNIRYLQSGGWTIPNARSVRLNRVWIQPSGLSLKGSSWWWPDGFHRP